MVEDRIMVHSEPSTAATRTATAGSPTGTTERPIHAGGSSSVYGKTLVPESLGRKAEVPAGPLPASFGLRYTGCIVSTVAGFVLCVLNLTLLNITCRMRKVQL